MLKERLFIEMLVSGCEIGTFSVLQNKAYSYDVAHDILLKRMASHASHKNG